MLALSLGLSACTGGGTAHFLRSPAPSPPPAATQATPLASKVDKIFLIVEENRSIQDVEAHMPFLMSQARSYGAATNFYAISHPSLPNYLVLAGGSTFGISDDHDPSVHQINGPSVFGKLVSAGRTAKTYAEAMQTNCARENQATYAVRHNPWTYFEDPAERSSCEQFDVPSGSLTAGALADDIAAGNLPTFGLLLPDLCHDGHDCSAAITDDWLHSWLLMIKNGRDFTSGRLAIVITWDEDDDNSGNHIPMVVIHPSLKDRQVTTRLDHYGVSKSISRIGGTRSLRDAKNQTDALAGFGL